MSMDRRSDHCGLLCGFALGGAFLLLPCHTRRMTHDHYQKIPISFTRHCHMYRWHGVRVTSPELRLWFSGPCIHHVTMGRESRYDADVIVAKSCIYHI